MLLITVVQSEQSLKKKFYHCTIQKVEISNCCENELLVAYFLFQSSKVMNIVHYYYYFSISSAT